jgi:hypothetical protein
MLIEKYDIVSLHPRMTAVERRIVFAVDAHEREFGRALPDQSFYKSLVLRICQQVSK